MTCPATHEGHRCQLDVGHDGPHFELLKASGPPPTGEPAVIISESTWWSGRSVGTFDVSTNR